MSNLFSPEGRAALTSLLAGPALLGFDFDGTLAPIRPTPAEVEMDARTAAAFAELTRRFPVAVITGRGVADVTPRLPGTPRWVIGNHGAEGLPGADPAVLAAQAAVCAGWRAQLEAAGALSAAGILFEDKRYTLSVHYRLAPEREAARAALLAQVALLAPRPHVVPGKCVLNLLPEGAHDKFSALQALAGEQQPVFFIGDDANDEIVFRQAPSHWVTVKVGIGATAARFRLAGQEAVADCLALLLEP